MRLDDLAARIGAELSGPGECDAGLIDVGLIDVRGVATLEAAGSEQLTFLSNPKYGKQLESTRAAAAIVAPSIKSTRLPLLKARNPYFAFCQAIVLLHGHRRHPHAGIHPAAHVDPTAVVGENTVIYPGASVGPRCRIGRDCVLYPGVCLYDDTVLGDRVIVHAGAILGTDGYGFATDAGVHHKIPQIGNLIVEDDVEIGATCAIARGALSSTIIGKGTKIDSLVMIGHGTTIGPSCLLVAQVGISGSVTVGRHVTLAGQVGVAGHLKIGDEAMVGAQAGITGDVPAKARLAGSPAIDIRRAKRSAVLQYNLPELLDRIKRLEKHAGIETPAATSSEFES